MGFDWLTVGRWVRVEVGETVSLANRLLLSFQGRHVRAKNRTCVEKSKNHVLVQDRPFHNLLLCKFNVENRISIATPTTTPLMIYTSMSLLGFLLAGMGLFASVAISTDLVPSRQFLVALI